jgi:predicted DNA-binding transcriptional regulator AlpA
MKKNPQSVDRIKPLYLAREEAAAFLSISDSMLDKLVAQGDAPKPRKLSAGRVAWLVEELEAWGKGRPVSDLLPPPNAGHHGRSGNPV